MYFIRELLCYFNLVFKLILVKLKGIHWRDELKNNIKNVENLHTEIPLEKLAELKKVAKIHPIFITRYYLENVMKKIPATIKMFAPNLSKLYDSTGEYDACNEEANSAGDGIQHKYTQTVLFLVTKFCFANCRYCFRLRFFIEEAKDAIRSTNREISTKISGLINFLKKHTEVDNVLFTGGDSLFLDTKLIAKFLKHVFKIDHIKYLRFGSKALAVFPNRIINDSKLLLLFRKYRGKGKKIYIITHFCHPGEITPDAIKAIKLLQQVGVKIRNQAPLLKGVNDDPEVLGRLFNKLIENGIRPYYIFQCRPVKGIKSEFQVPIARGFEIFNKAKSQAGGDIECKRVKFVMSDETGKIEIVWASKEDGIVLQYHQPKDKEKDSGRVIVLPYEEDLTWVKNTA